MFFCLLSFLLLFSTIFAINFPGRLSAEEAAELRKTCGRRPVESDVVEDKSFGSRLTNRREAPWVTSHGALISKRHILTCAHCVPRLAHSDPHWKTVFVMTCTDRSNYMNCTEKPMIERKVVEIIYHESYGSGMGILSDIAVLTLDIDIDTSRLVYPACLGGYSVNNTEIITNYGYGYSTQEELAKGIDQANFLQTFKATRLRRGTWQDRQVLRGIDPMGANSMSADSGSGYYHKNNGIASVYAVNDGRDRSEFRIVSYATRVSAHLYWINYVTGINAENKDMEFNGYFYPLMFKDKRNKKTFKAGASHPSRIVEYSNRK